MMWEICEWHQEESLQYQILKEEKALRRESSGLGTSG